jgi:hypothetical protein
MKTRARSAKGILLVVALCAMADFVIGCIHGRSIEYGIGRAVFGLAGTAFFLWIFGMFDNIANSDKPDD